jgi:integrator complex subunit 11
VQVPIYMTEGMVSRAGALFAALAEWGSQGLQKSSPGSSPFASPHFRVWRTAYAHAPGPCVLFATPGMLQGGASLQVFKVWAPDKGNLVLLPGYCAAGTVGSMLMAGKKKQDGKVLHLEDGSVVHVRCKVQLRTI